MKGPRSPLHVLILGLALAAFVSCKGEEKAAQTSASESTPAPAPAPAPAATATTTAEATTAEPKNKVAPAEAVDATVKVAVDTGQMGPSGEGALLGKPTPAAKGPVIPPGATAECNDSSYSMSHDKSMTCKGHSGVRHWLKP